MILFGRLRRRLRIVSRLRGKTGQLRSLRRLGLIGLGVLAAHAIAMVGFEGLDWFTAVWLTVTTVTTVGYGDVTAVTPEGQMSTMVLLYGGGVFIVAQAAGLFFEYQNERVKLKQTGEWIWNMSGHIVVINAPRHNRTRFLERLFEEFDACRASTHEYDQFLVSSQPKEYLLITEDFPNGLPKSLEKCNVKLQAGRGSDPETLEDANIREADGIVILAVDPFGIEFTHNDSLTFDVVHRIRNAGYTGHLVAEVVNSNNRKRMKEAGASAVVLPVRAFPGLLARALFHPGMEQVIESLFDSEGNECIAMSERIDGDKWREVIQRFVSKSKGTPIGYAFEGEVVSEPELNSTVKADTVYVLTGSSRH